ncbi:MAG: hypothetical protein ABJ139_05595 [Paracoccaceae bacterium]
MERQSFSKVGTDTIGTVNIFHHMADNIGDRLCGPAQYFWPEIVKIADFKYRSRKSENAILGGGQVFGQLKEFSKHWKASPNGHLVAWGVGTPLRGKNDTSVHAVVDRFSLFGTRNYDWHDSLSFVPCASCMSSIFDEVSEPEHEVVIYAHRRKTPTLCAPKGIPFSTNHYQDIREAIGFLARGETVVTSSYHGAYWAQLLGRRVVCIPYNDKFSTLEHTPTMATTETWQSQLKKANRTSPLLEEYRHLNQLFAGKVADLLEIDG